MPPEEAKRRNQECKKRYYENNKELLREKAKAARAADPEYSLKRRASYRRRIDRLIEEGVFEPAKRGRKPIYTTPEEAREAKKEQMKLSRARRAERLNVALHALNEKLLREKREEEDSSEASE